MKAMFYYNGLKREKIHESDLPEVDFSWAGKFSLAPFTVFQYFSLAKSLSLSLYQFGFFLLTLYLMLGTISGLYRDNFYALHGYIPSFSPFFVLSNAPIAFLIFKVSLLMLLLNFCSALFFEGFFARIKLSSSIFWNSMRYDEKQYKLAILSMEKKGKAGIIVFLILAGMLLYMISLNIGLSASLKIGLLLFCMSVSLFVFLNFLHRMGIYFTIQKSNHLQRMISKIDQSNSSAREDEAEKSIADLINFMILHAFAYTLVLVVFWNWFFFFINSITRWIASSFL
ncbi:MAG TPA: hypothetical protein PK581_06230 [Caldisericia bacterium]|nr:hypothetical protein [Caldisericia bacterium]